MNAALLAAMILVESNGNPRAVGDEGRSIGILQISRGVVDDVNRIRGTHYKWPDDCFDRKTSIEICFAYLSWYGGKSKSPEKFARIWNGGPRGHRNPDTRAYWRRVRAAMESQSK